MEKHKTAAKRVKYASEKTLDGAKPPLWAPMLLVGALTFLHHPGFFHYTTDSSVKLFHLFIRSIFIDMRKEGRWYG